MRSLIALSLCVILLLSLCACGLPMPGTPQSAPAETAEEPAVNWIVSSEQEAESPAAVDEPAPEQTPAEEPTVEQTPAEPPAPVHTEPFTVDTKIHDVIDHPAFAGFGRLLFPTQFEIPARLPIQELYYLLPNYHSINPENAAEVLNVLKDAAEDGQQIFYDIYSDEEKAADPAKADTGLFFFRGEPGAKFAVLSSGMAFRYVGSIHDSFPQANELAKRGYNAFALVFRPGKISGVEDLTRAIDFIFDHAEELGVNTADYSIWGGSSGAHFAVWYCEQGPGAFGGQDHGKPAIVVTQYTASYEVSPGDVPTYANLGGRDTYCQGNARDRINSLNAMGIESVLDFYENCWHGFGLGIGTEAEGWIDHAVDFWEKHMSS